MTVLAVELKEGGDEEKMEAFDLLQRAANFYKRASIW